jgi:hypothetical protein
MIENNSGQITIIPDNNQVNFQDVNQTITVTDNISNTVVDVIQPTTQVVQILTGPMGAPGASGVLPTSGSLNLTGSINVSGSISANNFNGGIFSGSFIGLFTGSFTGSLQGTSSWAQTALVALISQTASYVQSASYSETASYASQALSSSYALTASYIQNAQTASYVQNAQTASYVTTAQTASYVLNAISSSFSSTASYINLAQTASYVQNAQTASYVTLAQTASYVTTAQTASYVENAQTASYILNAISSSFATTASYVTLAQTASYVVTAQTASYVQNAVSSSFATTASYVENAQTASYVQNALSASYASTASYVDLAQTASYVTTAQTASYVITAQTASYVTLAQTASYVLNAISSSYSETASYLNTLNQNLTLNGNLILNGTASITYLDVTYESASIIYSSGSNQLGDATNDTQTLIGRTIISGSLEVTGSTNIPSITGSLLGTSSYAINAATASNILGGKATHVPFFITDTTLATSSIFQSGSTSIIINQDANTTANPEALYVWQPSTTSFNVISGKGNLNNYLQLNIQNTNQGVSSSSDVVATANNGNESINYIDMGINSENFTGSIGVGNDAYLYSTGRHLYIGNATNNPVVIFAGGFDTDANRKLQIDPNNHHELTGSLDISENLIVNEGITGSLLGTASYATQALSSSYALTASYASNIPLTASYALNALSASYASTASYVQNAQTASYVTTAQTASYVLNAISSSYALTASYASNVPETASYALNALSASYALTASYAISTSQAISSSYALTASYVVLSQTASYVTLAQTASYVTLAQTASYIQNAQTASYVLNAVSSSFATTASYASTYAPVFPYTGSAIISGSLEVPQISGLNTSGANLSIISTNNATKGTIDIGTNNAESVYFVNRQFQFTNVVLCAASNANGFLITRVTPTDILPNYVTNRADQTTGIGGTINTVSLITSGSTRLKASAAGNILIGTTTDVGYRLDVQGTSRFTSNVTIGSTGQLIEIYPTSNTPTYTQTGATSSLFTLKAGTRTLEFASYGTDNNYISSIGAKLGLWAAGAQTISFYTNSVERINIGSTGNFYFIDGVSNIQTGTTTGLKIGTATTQKLAFWNTTPIIQPANTTSLNAVLENTGLMAGGSTISIIDKPLVVSGSLNVTGGITGSLLGTASTASYVATAQTASYVVTAQTASYTLNAVSSSFAATASYVQTSQTASYVQNAVSASYVTTASYAITSSYLTLLNQQIILSGSFKLDPTQDPDPTGLDLDSTVLFQSSSNTALGYDLYVRQNGNLVKWKWIEGILETGLLYGGVVTYSGSNVFVSPGSGIIADHNATTGSEVSPMIEYVTWNAITQSITNIASQQVTYLYIDNTGTLQQQSTRFTSQQYHDYIPLGAVGHFDYTQISAFGGGVQTAYDQISQISNFIDAFGPLKMSGYGLTGQAGSLRLSVGSGTSFIHGGFYANNPEFPSQITTPLQATASLARINRSGSVIEFDTNAGNFYTVVDPTRYDRDGDGTLANVGSGNWSIQRVFSDPKTGILYVYYGQARYTSLLNALQFLPTDPFTEGDTFDFTTFIGFLVLKGNTSDIADTANNSIINGGLFRGSGQGSGGGIALSNLEDLTDVSITSPINGQALIYDAGIWRNGVPTNSTSASYVLNAVSASYVTTAQTASYVTLAQTASYVTLAQTASYVTLAQTASYVLQAVSSSFARTASYVQNAQTASYVTLAQTASYITLAQTASYVATAQTASYVLSSSYAVSSSNASTASYFVEVDPVFVAKSASLATTGSNTFIGNQIINGNITINGTASITYLDVTYESASVIYSSGSNQFGDATNDTQTLMGRVIVTGSLEVTGSTNIPSITGSLLGTSSYAIQALTSSYVATAQTASYVLQAVSSSYALTASYLSGYVSPFPYTGSAIITGSLIVTGSLTTRGDILPSDSFTYGLGNSSKIWNTFYVNNMAMYNMSAIDATNGLQFRTNANVVQMKMFNNGNFLLQNGGTFTDAGFKLDVQGTSNFAAKMIVSEGVNTFRGTREAFIGVNTDTGSGEFPGIWFNTSTSRTVSNYALLADSTNTIFNAPPTGTLLFRVGNVQKFRVFDNGNIIIQNGGTYTDAGFRLDVQGTTRFNGNSLITGSLTATSISSSAFNPTNITNNYFPVKSGSALVDSVLYQSVAGETLNWGNNATPSVRTFAITAANYPQVQFYNSVNSYAIGMGPAGGLSLTNAANNNSVISLANDASASIQIVGQSISTCFNGGNFAIGHNNIFTIPSKFYVVGNSIMTGSLTVSGSVMVTGGITGSLLGTATTASYVLQAVSASFATTASYYGGTVTTAATASYSTNFTVANTLVIDQTLTDYARVTSTITGANNLFTQATGSYRSAFGKYTLFNGTNARSGEFILVLNDTNVKYYDSSTTDIGNTVDIVFSAAIVGSDLQINADAASSGWTVRMLTTYL